MPILSPQHISTFQRIKFLDKFYLVESLNQKQINTLKEKPMIQGSIGVRVMDVGEIYWQTSIDTTVVVFDSGNSPTDLGNLFTLIVDRWNSIRNSSLGTQPTLPLLEKASINISKDALKANLTLISDGPVFQIIQGGVSSNSSPTGFLSGDYIARVVKWYDCFLEIGGTSYDNGQTFTFPQTGSWLAQIESAELDFDASVSRRFFIGSSQTPTYSVDSYKVSGKITFVVDTATIQALDLIDFQPKSKLKRTGPTGLAFGLYNPNGEPYERLIIGFKSMESQVENVIRAGDVNKVTITFTAFTS